MGTEDISNHRWSLGTWSSVRFTFHISSKFLNAPPIGAVCSCSQCRVTKTSAIDDALVCNYAGMILCNVDGVKGQPFLKCSNH